jgi:hypothetical protein
MVGSGNVKEVRDDNGPGRSVLANNDILLALLGGHQDCSEGLEERSELKSSNEDKPSRAGLYRHRQVLRKTVQRGRLIAADDF